MGERDPGGWQCACRGSESRGRHCEKRLEAGPLWPGVARGATAAGKVQGLTMRPAEESDGGGSVQAQGSGESLEDSCTAPEIGLQRTGSFEEMLKPMWGPVGGRGPGNFQGKVFTRSQDLRSEA